MELLNFKLMFLTDSSTNIHQREAWKTQCTGGGGQGLVEEGRVRTQVP